MNAATAALEAAISELGRLDKVIKKGRPRTQVTLIDERSLAKATALAWFNNHRSELLASADISDLDAIDSAYRGLLESSERALSRNAFLANIKSLRADLVQLRSIILSGAPSKPTLSLDQPPAFAPLISDPAMQSILLERWDECTKCLAAVVPLAATVMMGGLLEALLLSRINKEPNKQPIFSAKRAPRDKSGKTRPLSEWTLKDYIDVVHEMGWITQSAKDVGAVLRDYRNYIHPQKQLSHGLRLTGDDAVLLWEICKSIARQIDTSV